MEIPFNSWSPDNEFIFLAETTEIKSFIVINASDTVSTNADGTNVSELFRKQYPEYSQFEVTGWASPTLLIITTKTQNGEGPSYWFDVSSNSFIQLANTF